MTTKTREFKNETKVTQVYYDRHGNPIELKPGQKFVEDLSGIIDVTLLVNKEKERRALAGDVDEARRVKRQLALINVTMKLEELEKMWDNEKNQEVLDAILVRQKELIDANK